METIFYNYKAWQILYALVKQVANMSAKKMITEEQFIFEGFTSLLELCGKDRDSLGFVIEEMNKCDSNLKIQIFKGMHKEESVDCYFS